MSTQAEGVTRVIDAKFPLSWLIGCSCAIVFSMGGVYMQITSVAAAIEKIENKADIRDERMGLVSQNIVALQGDNRTQQAQIDRAASDILELARDVEDVKRNQTWVPK